MPPSPAPRIHPGASVHPDARLAPGVTVGPGVVVEADVEVGAGTALQAGTVLLAGARVGARCRLGPHAVVGGEPMDFAFAGEPSRAVLEDDVTLREFVTVHRATGENAETRVGAGSLLMCYVHVSHNCRLGRNCVVTNASQMGGHAALGDHVVLGAGALLHQFCRVGDHAMFGAGSGCNQDILPFAMARGNPARHFRANRVGLERRGFDVERRRLIERALTALRRGDEARFAELAEASADVRSMREFVATSRRGVARFAGR